jgi:hypothetical protein
MAQTSSEISSSYILSRSKTAPQDDALSWRLDLLSKLCPSPCIRNHEVHICHNSRKAVYNLGFDGINIDYEYVTSTTQATQLVKLLQKLRSEMVTYAQNTTSTPFLLSFASPSGPLKYTLLDFKGMEQYLDFWDFMGFDYSGSWDIISGHSSNLYPDPSNPASTLFNTSTAIEYYISVGGISPSKINLGSPLYGQAFSGTEGPGTLFNGVGTGGSFGMAGIWDYKALPIANSTPIVTEMAGIGASYSYDESRKYMISYDTPNIARQKAQWIETMGLGGAMWWEISMDKGASESLVGVMVEEFKMLDNSENHLEYPLSEFENLRGGMVDTDMGDGSKDENGGVTSGLDAASTSSFSLAPMVTTSTSSTLTSTSVFTASPSSPSPNASSTPIGSGSGSLEALLEKIIERVNGSS